MRTPINTTVMGHDSPLGNNVKNMQHNSPDDIARQVMQLQAELNKLKTKQLRTIGLSNINEIQFVHLDNIIRLEAASNYTHFYLDSGEKITVSYTLKHYEEVLCHNDFMRVHQSHMINLNKVKKYIKGSGGYAIMEDGQNICIAPSRKDCFLKALQLV